VKASPGRKVGWNRDDREEDEVEGGREIEGVLSLSLSLTQGVAHTRAMLLIIKNSRL
jgi:hypothetical protein